MLEEIDRRRQASYEQLARDLRSERYTALMSDWYRWLDHDASPGPVGTDPLGPIVAQRITKAQRRLVNDGRKITPSSPPPQLHDLRKDAKKLRYLIECFGSLFEAKPRKRFVQRLKALQDNLGEHQDAEVHVSQMRELANDLHATSAVDADALLAMGQLTEHLEARRRAARVEFEDRFRSYDTKATARSARRARPNGAAVKTLATYSIKGGVGKTTTAVNLSYEASKAGARVLLWIWTPRAPPRSCSGYARR